MITTFANDVTFTNTYTSPYGWSIDLPAGWSKLPDASNNSLGGFRPALFCSDSDWSLSITWTRIRAASYDAMQQFEDLCAITGPIPLPDVDAVVSKLVPLVGETTKAESITVASGHAAIEIIKLCNQSGVLAHRFGIDLLVNTASLRSAQPGTSVNALYIDKLSFYANADAFPGLLPSVKNCMRSIRFPISLAV